jgi:DNA-binding protein Fis
MERHVAPSALARLFSGQASEPEAELAVPHLVRCRRCWDQAARVAGELRREDRLAPGAATAGAVLLLIEEEDSQALRRLRALGGWAKLRRLSARQQLDGIKADPALQTLEMFATLAEAAACTSREDPHLGEETALVAHALAAALPEDRYPEPFRDDLQGEALAIVANCRRLAGDWRGSAAAFGNARDHLLHGTGEPVRKARLLSLQASLATDTGRLEQALELLVRAAALYSSAQDTAAVASVTVKEAYTFLAACRYEEAIGRAEAALRCLAPEESRLAMLARSIVTESLVSLGRPLEALRSFLATQPLFKRLWGRKNELISGYLEALLLDALGHAREADKAFRNNIAKTLEAELYKDAFVATLAHFECLFRRGALDKAARVCEEAIERIEQAGAGCHAQMTELWRDLLTLVEARRLTEHQVLAARQYLVRHWNAPASHAPLERSVRSPGFSVPFREKPGPAVRPENQGWHVPARPAATAPDPIPMGYEEVLERYDRELVAEGLASSGGSVRETSRLLGISRNTLRAKIRKYGLAAEETPEPAADPGPLSEEEATRAVNWLRTRTWWAELKMLPRGQQLERLQTVSSLQTREMFDVMIEEAATVALEDPDQGQKTALLAHTLAGLLPRSVCPEPVRHDLQGEALRIVANCRRLAGDWQGCAATLGAARNDLERGSGDPAREARHLSIEASLAADTGQEEEALALLARASLLDRRAQDPASVTVQEASALLSAGRHEEAIARAEEALRCLPPGEARLELLARNIVTESLVFLGRPAEALRSLFAAQPLYEQLRGPRTELQWGYLVALLLDAQGLGQESEKVYQDNVAGLMEAGLFKNAFWSLLTQFESLFRRGALDQAARTCEEALARIEEAGMDGHGPMKELWRNLLTLVQARRLTESDLREGLHSLVRSGDAPENRVSPGDDLPPEGARPLSQAPQSPDPATSLAEEGYKQALESYDRQLVAAALAQGKGSIAETSRLLGIPRNSLRAKLKRYFLSGDEE